MKDIKSKFGIGHIVAYVGGGQDCNGTPGLPRTAGLKVERIVLVRPTPGTPHPIEPYFRVLAIGPGGAVKIEAAEQFFEREDLDDLIEEFTGYSFREPATLHTCHRCGAHCPRAIVSGSGPVCCGCDGGGAYCRAEEHRIALVSCPVC